MSSERQRNPCRTWEDQLKHLDLSDTVTTKDLLKIFGVTSETSIWKWRRFRGLDDHAIRIDADERYFVRFYLAGVLDWAKEHNKAMPGLEQWRADRKTRKKPVSPLAR